MESVYQIVDKDYKLVNSHIYTELEEAQEKCYNLKDNYNEFFQVVVLSMCPKNLTIS